MLTFRGLHTHTHTQLSTHPVVAASIVVVAFCIILCFVGFAYVFATIYALVVAALIVGTNCRVFLGLREF